MFQTVEICVVCYVYNCLVCLDLELILFMLYCVSVVAVEVCV
jgi:hypothetical protein